MKKLIIATVPLAASLAAQTPQIVENRQIHVVAAQPAGAMGFVNIEMGFESTLVKGAPFTGEFVTENTQTLADGNRLHNASTTSFARDSEGRIRREMNFDGIPSLDGSAPIKTIFIHDPVAKIDYILDPQAKTARKMILGPPPVPPTASGSQKGQDVNFQTRLDGPGMGNRAVMIRRSGPGPRSAETAEFDTAPLPAGIVMSDGGGAAVVAQRIQIGGAMATPGANTNFKNESLGKRLIEGLETEGTRSIFTIPAGQIGNDRPLETVSERWFSDELKMVVLTTRKDPRSGENTYRLTNLRRGEPARQLFELPPDYKIITEDHVGPNIFRMRTDKKP